MSGSTGVVIFVYADWIAQYPELSSVNSTQAQGYFNQAALYCDNTPCSPIQDLTQRTILLYQVTAHIAALFAALNGQSPRALVGRIASATEGSVNVQTVYVTPTNDLQAWFSQTTYGAAFWAATTRYRTGFFVPPVRCGYPGYPGYSCFPGFMFPGRFYP